MKGELSMSKIGRQQINPDLLTGLGGNSNLFYGENEPEAGQGAVWLQTGFGGYEIEGKSELVVKNAIVSEEEPQTTTNLWFDVE